jgi:uncharacterized membrane protein YbhN (UPF0104 family)
VSSAVDQVTPFHDPSRGRRFVKIAGWIVGLVVLVVVLNLAGVDVVAWLESVWDQIKEVPPQYIVFAAILQVLQTSLNGLAYYGILAYGYGSDRVQLWPVITAYAVGVSMNNFLPANIGTFVTLLMFVAIIPGASFPGVFAAYLVNKIFFTIVGGLVYLYLFLEAGSAFDVELGWFRDHGLLGLLLAAGAVLLVVIVARVFWRWVKKLWERARAGAEILVHPRAYLVRVFLPQVGSYAAKVGVICVFLAAYSIPVTFASVMAVIGSSSAANMTSVTPGAVGITQAANVVALKPYTDSDTATAYSLSQQLITTAINLGWALLLVVVVFGWTGGKLLVSQSYSDAKVKVHEMKESRGKGEDVLGLGEGGDEPSAPA